MPKDKNGSDLPIGSLVLIRGKVVHASEQTSGHNLTVESLEVIPGSANPPTRSHISIASSQVELVESSSPTEELEEAAKPEEEAEADAPEGKEKTKSHAAKHGRGR